MKKLFTSSYTNIVILPFVVGVGLCIWNPKVGLATMLFVWFIWFWIGIRGLLKCNKGVTK